MGEELDSVTNYPLRTGAEFLGKSDADTSGGGYIPWRRTTPGHFYS